MSDALASRIFLLEEPSVRMTLSAVTRGCVFGRDYEAFITELAGRLPYGLHGLGWYLRWLMYHHSSFRESVIRYRNVLSSEKTIRDFGVYIDRDFTSIHLARLHRKTDLDPLDVPVVVVYDHLVRNGRSPEADEWLARTGPVAVGEYIGLPFVRCVLTETTETTLWTLASCPRGHYSRP